MAAFSFLGSLAAMGFLDRPTAVKPRSGEVDQSIGGVDFRQVNNIAGRPEIPDWVGWARYDSDIRLRSLGRDPGSFAQSIQSGDFRHACILAAGGRFVDFRRWPP